MFKNFFSLGLQNSGRTKFAALILFLFLIFLSDSILSYFTPYSIEEKHGPLIMGIIMSVSSLAGIIFDFFFPIFVKRASINKLILLAIAANILFIGALIIYSLNPMIMFVLLGVISWGIYYELLGFSRQQYIATSITKNFHASAWGLMETVRGTAYTIGPLIAGFAISQGEIPALAAAGFFTFGALFIFLFRSKLKQEDTIENSDRLNLWDEFHKWKILASKTKIVIVSSILMSIIDATIWTVGVVWAEKIASTNYLGNFFIPTYEFPIIFLGMLIARMNIKEGKKIKSELFLIASGIILMCLYFITEPILILLVILILSILLSFSFTLNAAIYSDLEERMGIEKRHLIGLSQSTASFSYIVGPIVAGLLASKFGEQMTFVYIGLFVAVATGTLFLATPKKIKLPQSEIREWK